MIELLHWDEHIFQLINSEWQNPFFDLVMPWLRNKYTWFPLYLFIFTFLVINFKKAGLVMALFIITAIGISDYTSSQLIKKNVRRARPCKVMEQPADMNLLVPCGSGYSFPSSHASNHFAISLFLFLSLGRLVPKYRYLLFLWAGLVSFAQVYVGLHYPLDIMAGGILGSLIGWLVFLAYRKFAPLPLD